MKSLLCSAVQAVWGFLMRGPIQPTRPVNSKTQMCHLLSYLLHVIKHGEDADQHLHRDSLSNVHYQLYVGIVVIVGSPGYRNIMVSHFYVFCQENKDKHL